MLSIGKWKNIKYKGIKKPDISLQILCYYFFLILIFLSSPSVKAQSRYKFEGNITDIETFKPLLGISVRFNPTGMGTVTDEKGYFSLFLPEGRHEVVFSAIGYQTKSKTFEIRENLKLEIELKPTVKQLEEVIITGKTPDHNIKEVEMGNIKLDMIQLKKVPIVFGEPDIIKTLMLQPGVSTVGEGAGGFNVRGGRTDQNLVLLDNAPLFNTSHLLGFFSNVNPDAIQDVTLYKGNVTAQYGGRLASLLDIRTKSGNEEKFGFSGGISPVSVRFLAEGPLIKEKLTVIASTRIAYPNWVMGIFPGETKKNRAFFYDINGKIYYKLSQKNRLSLSAYHSSDNFKFPEDTLYSWQNNLATFQWNTFLNKKFSFSIYAIQSQYDFQVTGQKEFYTFKTSSSIRQRQLKANFLLNPSEKYKFDFGGESIWYNIQPGSRQPFNENSIVNALTLDKEFARETAGYFNSEIILTPSLTISVGLRYVGYQKTGPGKVYAYEAGLPRSRETLTDTNFYSKNEKIIDYSGFEPRIGLRLGLSKDMSLKLSYNRMRQFLHLISNTSAITPVDFWKTSDPFVPPQVSDQYSIGFFKNFSDNIFETSIELYYKDISNLVEYKNGATLLLNPVLETDLLKAKGKNYGMEVSIRKNKGKWYGQIAYTYSRSLVAVLTDFPNEQINRGAFFPSNFDKPHNIVLTQTVQMTKGWTFNTNFAFSTGRPVSYPDGLYVINDLVITDYSRRNADRIPNYHRLDISFVKDTRRTLNQKKYFIWNVSFYNLYARKNPYSVYFTQYRSVSQSYRLSVFGTIIPSVTCNFVF